MRVLIADDNRDVVDSLGLLIEGTGREVFRAYDSVDALLLCTEKKPEVIVLDLRMPGPSGVDVCRSIRATDWGQRACIASLSAWADDEYGTQANRGEFDAFFLKPLEWKVLSDWLTHVAEHGRNK